LGGPIGSTGKPLGTNATSSNEREKEREVNKREGYNVVVPFLTLKGKNPTVFNGKK